MTQTSEPWTKSYKVNECDQRRSPPLKLLWYASYIQLSVCLQCDETLNLSLVYVTFSIAYPHVKKEHLRVVQMVI